MSVLGLGRRYKSSFPFVPVLSSRSSSSHIIAPYGAIQTFKIFQSPKTSKVTGHSGNRSTELFELALLLVATHFLHSLDRRDRQAFNMPQGLHVQYQ